MKLRLLFLTVAILSLSQITSAQQAQTGDSQSRGYIVKVGDIAPDFEIELTNGQKFTLSSLRGKVVMLQFTASWCSVCRKEMPHIESDIWLKHKDDKSFALFGIDLKESAEITDKFAESMKITYPLSLDLKGEKFALYTEPNAGVTRNIIIGRDGRIIMLTRLYDEKEFAEMANLITKELSK